MKRARVLARGAVQGVGFRPFVRRLAVERGLVGSVRNTPSGVEVEVEGDDARVDELVAALGRRLEVSVEVEPRPMSGGGSFVVEPSETAGRARAALPPDLAPCSACSEELSDPASRRAGYAFTSCTSCGPRWSIALGAPWDRERTTMAPFALCAPCAAEHASLADRRSHAETLACPTCGPRLWLTRGANAPAAGDDALAQAAQALRQGEVAAVKGVGGWQLVADATDEGAVAALRTRKAREARPFAVLFASKDELLRHAAPTDEELRVLEGPAAPIVLVCARAERPLAPSVAPSSRLVGAMLPASPLHALLARAAGRPLVCTSGNLAGEPLAFEDDDARARLGRIADVFVGHERAIARPLDDSVVRVTALGPVFVRRARGAAPRPLPRREPGPVVLALGAELKTTVALALEDEVWVSAHVGDLGPEATLERLHATAREMLAWAGVRPEVIACDLHPELGSTRLAEALARELGAELVRVQHHAAHLASVAAEHGLGEPLFGLVWDGMGFGEDGALWGGEALELEGVAVRRLAHLRPFALPGGDAAIREPRRAALGLLHAARLPLDAIAAAFSPEERAVLVRAMERGVNSPTTTAVGRLFDAVAALLGLCARSRFEAEAALALEQAAQGEPMAEPLPMPLAGPLLDWAPLVEGLLASRAAGASVAALSARFHASLALAAGELASRSGAREVALAGGCFQNARLVSGVAAELERRGVRAWLPRELPPGDGGLALGQALLASRRCSRVSRGSR